MSGGIRVLAQSYASSTSEDVISSNSWIFGTTDHLAVAETDLIAAVDLVEAFYNSVGALLGKQKSQIRFKAYDLGESPPRTPFDGGALTVATGSASLPSEVAICISYWNGLVPRPRKRGRLYLGPLVQSVIDNTATVPRVTTTARSTIAGAGSDLIADNTVVTWGILSEADAVIRTIEHGYVDDAFDIQRRRGEDPSTRLEFS
jgi:hypothetical protein